MAKSAPDSEINRKRRAGATNKLRCLGLFVVTFVKLSRAGNLMF